MTHTPGPWESLKLDNEWSVYSTTQPTDRLGRDCIVANVRKRDASLIAAAPDLLAALQQAAAAFATINNTSSDGHIRKFAIENFRQARAAIAKATGGQS